MEGQAFQLQKCRKPPAAHAFVESKGTQSGKLKFYQLLLALLVLQLKAFKAKEGKQEQKSSKKSNLSLTIGKLQS
uniref:Uncharacterized protein n=1 Tax=Leersia perrieri TaxID=77586 RepID=A0A0D9VWN1_9ORYZ